MTTKLYVWDTPNGRKPLILAEELGIDYEMIPVDISKNEQREPAFLELNPNGRIPVMFDEGEAVFESGAILIALAEKHGQFLPKSGPERNRVFEWLMFQMAGIGPMFGQAYHFKFVAPKNTDDPQTYGVERYQNEAKRLYGVLESRLGEVEFLAGEYSIADMATYPWTRQIEPFGADWGSFPKVKRWVDAVAARPAVKRAMDLKIA